LELADNALKFIIHYGLKVGSRSGAVGAEKTNFGKIISAPLREVNPCCGSTVTMKS